MLGVTYKYMATQQFEILKQKVSELEMHVL